MVSPFSQATPVTGATATVFFRTPDAFPAKPDFVELIRRVGATHFKLVGSNSAFVKFPDMQAAQDAVDMISSPEADEMIFSRVEIAKNDLIGGEDVWAIGLGGPCHIINCCQLLVCQSCRGTVVKVAQVLICN